jgi:hypothetical protein
VAIISPLVSPSPLLLVMSLERRQGGLPDHHPKRVKQRLNPVGETALGRRTDRRSPHRAADTVEFAMTVCEQ